MDPLGLCTSRPIGSPFSPTMYASNFGDPVNLIDPSGMNSVSNLPDGLGALIIYDRSTGLLTAIDNDKNSITIMVSENGAQSKTPGDPYGTSGRVPLGIYNITPRPSDLRFRFVETRNRAKSNAAMFYSESIK